MGITKRELKTIVKECLIEILAEGMGNSTGEMISEASKRPKSFQQGPALHSSEILKQNASKTKMVAQNLVEVIKKEARGNDVLADILADTAATTLPAMMESDSHRGLQLPPTGNAERAVASHTPEQLFGDEVSSKWAALAFMGQSIK